MSKLLEVLKEQKSIATSEPACMVADWLLTLNDEEAQEFIECMKVPNLSALGLYNALVKQGIDLPFRATTFRSHVKGYCICQR
jgi:hypothetical protein